MVRSLGAMYISSRQAVRTLAILLLVWMVQTPSELVHAQSSNGFIRFGGTVETISEEGDRVALVVQVFGARVSVELDEHATITGSLGGRTSSRSLSPGDAVEIQGWMRPDGSIRASEVELKVQTGAIRMSGVIESILPVEGGSSILVNGAEFRVDERTVIVVDRDGVSQNGSLEELAAGSEVEIRGSQIDQTGTGSATSSLFRADRILALNTFRLQGIITSRIPSTGTPTAIFVQGIAITLTPETSIAGNGLNERNEAFLARDRAGSLVIVRGIEDDAGSPCGVLNRTAEEMEQLPNCPDVPSDPLEAGDLQIGLPVRVEGVLEDTGFSTRYTARAIQVERMSSHIRFQGMVATRTADSLVVQINEAIATAVVLDASTRLEGTVEPGRFVEISAEMNPDLTIRARRIKQIP